MNPLSENCCARNEIIFKFLNLDIEDHVGSDSYNCQDRVVGFPLRWYKGGSKSGALSCIASIIQRSCCLRVSFRWLLSNNLYHERNNAWRVIRSREETSIPSCFRSNRYPAITGSISNRSSGRWRANRRILGSRIKRGYWNKSRVQVGPGDRSTSIHKSFPVAINRSY